MGGHGRCLFMTGGTGYMGHRLITSLLGRGHEVRALVRAGSGKKLPGGLHCGSRQCARGRELRGKDRGGKSRPGKPPGDGARDPLRPRM